MNTAEIVSVLVAIVLIIAVPWVGTLIGTRNFHKRLDDWRAKTQSKASQASEEETAA